MKALGVLVLRFKEPQARRWRVPFNIRVRGREIPIGLSLITVVLFSLAGINLLTKKTATLSGVGFTLIFFTAFSLSERRYKPKELHQPKLGEEPEIERFRLEVRKNLSETALRVRPGNIVVAAHDPNNLRHLHKVLEEIDPKKTDIVVLSVNSNVHATKEITDPAQVVDQCETAVFSQVVHAAEKVGKPAWPIAMPGRDSYGLILQAARQLRSSRVVVGTSAVMSLSEQKQKITVAWDRLSLPGTLCVEIISGDQSVYLNFGGGSES